MISKDEQLKMIQWLDETKKLGKDSVLQLGTKVQDYDNRHGIVTEINKSTESYSTVIVQFDDGVQTTYSYDNFFDVLREI